MSCVCCVFFTLSFSVFFIVLSAFVNVVVSFVCGILRSVIDLNCFYNLFHIVFCIVKSLFYKMDL